MTNNNERELGKDVEARIKYLEEKIIQLEYDKKKISTMRDIFVSNLEIEKEELSKRENRLKEFKWNDTSEEKKLLIESVKKNKEIILKLQNNIKKFDLDIIQLYKKILKNNTVLNKLLNPEEFGFIWKILSGLFIFSTVILLGLFVILRQTDLLWIGATFTFVLLFIIVLFFLVYLGKKTHAIMEFKANMSGKPISLFFTDHKRLDWKVVEPEGNMLIDKSYGAFIINEKGAYIDKKTKNVFLAFNPSAATNASVECFKLSDALNKVLKDEKQLAEIRKALIDGQIEGDDIIFYHNGQKEKLSGFGKLRENVDFSHLKSLLNTLIPHAINSKIEMTIQQRMSGFGKVNWVQIALIFLSVIGAVTLAIIMLNMYGGGGGGTTTIVQQVAANVTAPIDPSSVITG